MKKSLIALLVMTILTSCFSCKSFKINVNLDNTTGKTICLNRLEGGSMTTIKSVVAKDNQAVFKVKQSDNNDALHIMIDGWRRPLTFFADNQDVTIVGDYQKYNEIEVKASESQEKVNEVMALLNTIEDDEDIHFVALDFVKKNIDNPVGAYILYRYKWAFEMKEIEKLYAIMPADMQSGYKDEINEYIEGLKKTMPGEKFLDFTQKDINGNDFTLSELVGKPNAIILDFWASWCPDCRKANPDLVKIYNQFKDKGLEIVSISLDTDQAKWKKAIADDNLTWPYHVSDLKGWNNEVAQQYTISFIPQNLILDKNGVILDKNVPFEKMEELLSKLMK